MTINVLSILNDTTVDGPGFRTSIYCSGCKHHCKGCHNPQSWAFGAGEDRTIDSLMQEIIADPIAHVTFTGGDPFYQAAGFTELAARIKAETDKTIWCYTGFLFEDLIKVIEEEHDLALKLARESLQGSGLDELSSTAAYYYLFRAKLIRGNYSRERIFAFFMLTMKSEKSIEYNTEKILKERELSDS